jgi:hypothetical protein
MSTFFNIDLKHTYNSINLVVKDLAGKEILKADYKHQSILKVSLDNFSKGVYFVKIVADNKNAVLKLTHY